MHLNGSGIQPQFKLSYSTVDEYGLHDLSPLSWADLVERYDSFILMTSIIIMLVQVMHVHLYSLASSSHTLQRHAWSWLGKGYSITAPIMINHYSTYNIEVDFLPLFPSVQCCMAFEGQLYIVDLGTFIVSCVL